jgi:hypothetical protein
MKKTTATTIAGYNALTKGEIKKVCTVLKKEIDKALPKSKATSKLWHGGPVWFINGNPVVGYSLRKAGDVNVLFWSGQSFKHKGLHKEGSFKAAEIKYASVADMKLADLRKWLKECQTIQWDYEHIVRNRGLLKRLRTSV